MTEEEVFTQEDYSNIVYSLDSAMAIMKSKKFGKTEMEARDWLAELFV